MKELNNNNKEELVIRTAAVCVYPSRVPDAHDVIKRMDLIKTLLIAAGNF